MVDVGLDLSRKRLDYCVLDREGELLEQSACPPDADALSKLALHLHGFGEPVQAAIESMNGARFVHDLLESGGIGVEIADALKVKGLAPLAVKTDRIDARVLAELSRPALVPAIWLPDPSLRQERERARFRGELASPRSQTRESSPLTVGSPGFGRGLTCSVVHCGGSLSGRNRRSRVP